MSEKGVVIWFTSLLPNLPLRSILLTSITTLSAHIPPTSSYLRLTSCMGICTLEGHEYIGSLVLLSLLQQLVQPTKCSVGKIHILSTHTSERIGSLVNIWFLPLPLLLPLNWTANMRGSSVTKIGNIIKQFY